MSHTFLIASVLITIASVVMSALLIKSNASTGGVTSLALWSAIVLIATAVLIAPVTGRFRSSAALVTGAAILVVLLGLVTAFISGDKYDTVRAAVIFFIMIIAGYRRRGRTI